MKRYGFFEGQLPVGPLLPPPGTYSFTAVSPPIHAPGQEPLAQLAHVPLSLGSVGAAFPPFGRPPLRMPSNPSPPEERIAYRTIGLVQYRGDEGQVIIETVMPSAAALRKDLVLGNPVRTLPDGTPLFAIWSSDLRFRRGDIIVDLYAEGGGITQQRLAELAEDVVLI